MAIAVRSAAERIRDALKYLVIARQAEVDPSVGLVYLKGLEDIEPSLVERVCEALGKAPREDFKPALPELGAIRARCEELALADQAALDASRLLPLPSDDDADPRTHVFCRDCRDEISGWRFMWCPGGGELADKDRPAPDYHTPKYYCGRKFAHRPHHYVEKCACYATNPVIARKRAAMGSKASKT